VLITLLFYPALTAKQLAVLPQLEVTSALMRAAIHWRASWASLWGVGKGGWAGGSKERMEAESRPDWERGSGKT
jgi:hypothetical protein